MILYETTTVLEKTALSKICFILDASESAAQHQSAMIRLVRELLSALPVGIPRTLYFLGNASSYAPDRFARQATQWFMENRARASLVTPIWETLEQKDATIVIIGAGRIFDLEEWAGTPLAQRTVLVRVGESLQSGPYIAEEIKQPTAQQLLQRLYDPVTSIKMAGRGFMPTWWDNPAYQLAVAGGKASLRAERLPKYSLALRFVALPDGKVQAIMTHASGKQTAESVTPTDFGTLVGPEEGWLKGKEADLFRCAIQRQPFTCLHCGRRHAWDTLFCQEGAIMAQPLTSLGKVVYPSIREAHDAKGFVIFHPTAEGVHFEVYPSVLRLNNSDVAIREGQKATIYRFDARKKRWIQTNMAFRAYHPTQELDYAILL